MTRGRMGGVVGFGCRRDRTETVVKEYGCVEMSQSAKSVRWQLMETPPFGTSAGLAWGWHSAVCTGRSALHFCPCTPVRKTRLVSLWDTPPMKSWKLQTFAWPKPGSRFPALEHTIRVSQAICLIMRTFPESRHDCFIPDRFARERGVCWRNCRESHVCFRRGKVE